MMKTCGICGMEFRSRGAYWWHNSVWASYSKTCAGIMNAKAIAYLRARGRWSV